MIWHLLTKGESYLWARPSLHAKKIRDLELKAGFKAARGQKGAAHTYNIKRHREQERRWVEQAETACPRFLTGWNPRGAEEAAHGRRKRGAMIKAARQGSHLTPCSSRRGHPCARKRYRRSAKKALVHLISGPGMLRKRCSESTFQAVS